jgi:hypothetical protein
LEALDLPNFSPEWQRTGSDEGIMFFFEIFPNFLIVFDLCSFFFFDLESLEAVKPLYPNLISDKSLIWVDPLPNWKLLSLPRK